jgi:hypothetical protein
VRLLMIGTVNTDRIERMLRTQRPSNHRFCSGGLVSAACAELP